MNEMFIPALDGHSLATTHFPGANSTGPVVLISSGVAIPQRFYHHFAEWLAHNGASSVITWDYRGIGGSWPSAASSDRRKFSYLMSDWALQDYPAMIDWIKTNHPERPLYVVGHSFGGQALGLCERNHLVDKSVLIAAMSAYWPRMVFPEKFKVLFTLSILGPVVGRIYGYIPGKFGLGEDMSLASFAQWARWCRNPEYFFTDPELPQTRNFASYKAPLLAIGLGDDPWATPELIDHLVGHFTAAQVKRRQFSPDTSGGKIGHFNFFKPRFEETLWKPVGEWLFAGE